MRSGTLNKILLLSLFKLYSRYLNLIPTDKYSSCPSVKRLVFLQHMETITEIHSTSSYRKCLTMKSQALIGRSTTQNSILRVQETLLNWEKILRAMKSHHHEGSYFFNILEEVVYMKLKILVI